MMETLDQGKLAEARGLLNFEVECRAGAKSVGISPAEYMLHAAAEAWPPIRLGVIGYRGGLWIADTDNPAVQAMRYLKGCLGEVLSKYDLEFVEEVDLGPAAIQYLQKYVLDAGKPLTLLDMDSVARLSKVKLYAPYNP